MLLRKTTWFWKSGLAAISFVSVSYTHLDVYKRQGMGIIGHQFSLSWSAIEWTLAGFLAIKLTALPILSGRIRSAVSLIARNPASVHSIAEMCIRDSRSLERLTTLI